MADDRLRVLGERVRAARGECGWSQERLGEAAGLHRNYVGAVERGEHYVSIRVLFALADALGVRAADLLPD